MADDYDYLPPGDGSDVGPPQEVTSNPVATVTANGDGQPDTVTLNADQQGIASGFGQSLSDLMGNVGYQGTTATQYGTSSGGVQPADQVRNPDASGMSSYIDRLIKYFGDNPKALLPVLTGVGAGLTAIANHGLASRQVSAMEKRAATEQAVAENSMHSAEGIQSVGMIHLGKPADLAHIRNTKPVRRA